MKNFFLFLIAACLAVSVNAQDEPKLKQYFFVLLVKGQQRYQDSSPVAEIQKGHLANITSLNNEGKIDLAGPFGDYTDWR